MSAATFGSLLHSRIELIQCLTQGLEYRLDQSMLHQHFFVALCLGLHTPGSSPEGEVGASSIQDKLLRQPRCLTLHYRRDGRCTKNPRPAAERRRCATVVGFGQAFLCAVHWRGQLQEKILPGFEWVARVRFSPGTAHLEMRANHQRLRRSPSGRKEASMPTVPDLPVAANLEQAMLFAQLQMLRRLEAQRRQR